MKETPEDDALCRDGYSGPGRRSIGLCGAEVARYNAWAAEHARVCTFKKYDHGPSGLAFIERGPGPGGWDRVEITFREGIFYVITAHCQCGASIDISHLEHS